MAKILSKMKALGVGARGSQIEFSIQPDTGYVATARLSHNDETVAKWKSDEILGSKVVEPLAIAGSYKLEVLVSVFSPQLMDLKVAVALTLPGTQPSPKTLSFKQTKAGDVCEALTFALIQ